ncbi:MAG: hypothetical protein AB1643_00120 [Patescibacteria group bacterium]
MAIPWTVRRQLTFFFVFFFIVLVVAILIWVEISTPTCSDKKQNQEEEGIDCGGPCQPCISHINDLIVQWTKVLKIKEGFYDGVVLIDNPNLSVGIPLLKYEMKIYDDENALVGTRRGQTFINPDDKFIIIEPNLETQRTPKKVFIEFDKNIEWKRTDEAKPQIVISGKEFSNNPLPRLTVKIDNKSIFPVEKISVAAILYDENRNVFAASTSKLDYIESNSSDEVIMTWPERFDKTPFLIDVLIKTNLTL